MQEIKKPKDKEYRENNKVKKKRGVTWAYGAIGKQAKRFDKEKGKQVDCLGCGVSFLGRINVRICTHCKKKESYSTGTYFADIQTGQVC